MTVGEFKEFMGVITDNYKTIPMVFNKITFIGGYNDMCKLLKVTEQKATMQTNPA
jgi:hypothetical protein